MCKSISLLSGKGGSGKTTLSLSIASLLSYCGIKVLLIDCDLSTNGATYFYESKLQTTNIPYSSFHSILSCNEDDDYRFVTINDYFDFLPSIIRIDDETRTLPAINSYYCESMHRFFRKHYDVVIFDCQAGYTDLLHAILPYTDVNLVVMEADSISSSALRSLYLKIGSILNAKKLYQVFNKVSSDEYDIYSKVSGGTFFTNIESIRFDWSVRKAFSVSQVPDLFNTSINYGKQILNICKTLLPEDRWQEQLNSYQSVLYIHHSLNEEERLKREITDLEHKQANRTFSSFLSDSFITPVLPILVMLSSVISLLSTDVLGLSGNLPSNKLETKSMLVLVLSLVLVCVLVFFIFYSSSYRKERHSTSSQIRENTKRIKLLRDERYKLSSKLKTSELRNVPNLPTQYFDVDND